MSFNILNILQILYAVLHCTYSHIKYFVYKCSYAKGNRQYFKLKLNDYLFVSKYHKI